MIESSIEFRVRYAETDQMGMVYHANFLIWCEMGRTDLLRTFGMSYAELEDRGVYLAVSEARIRFRAPARYDDRIRVRTTLSRVRSRGVRFSYAVEHAETGRRLASAETDLICLDAERSPRPLPESLRLRLEPRSGATVADGTSSGLEGVVDRTP